jgi:hypothetical protein
MRRALPGLVIILALASNTVRADDPQGVADDNSGTMKLRCVSDDGSKSFFVAIDYYKKLVDFDGESYSADGRVDHDTTYKVTFTDDVISFDAYQYNNVVYGAKINKKTLVMTYVNRLFDYETLQCKQL